MDEKISVLQDRADYLRVRIEAKKSVGWEYQYDVRERDALVWALDQLTAHDDRGDFVS
jgi:hypothetical protein